MTTFALVGAGLRRRLLVGGVVWARWGGVVSWSVGLLRGGDLIAMTGVGGEVVRLVQSRVMSDSLGFLSQVLVEVGQCWVG